jgi:hypothetical protein
MGIKVVASATERATSSTAVARLRASIQVADSPSATIEYQALAAGTQYANPTAAVSYAIPVSQVAYIDLALGAILDTTGQFKFIPQVVVVTDDTSFVLAKTLAVDFTPVTDLVTVSALKALADGLTMVDAETFDTLKALADSAPMLDDETIDVAKLLQDNQQLQDLVAKVLSKSLSDTFGLTDDETVSALKGLSDSVEMLDVIEILLVVLRTVDDVVSVPDLRATLFTPATKIEQITVVDEDNIDYQKNIADGFAMNDGSEAVDGSTYSFHKGISNVAFVGDVRSLIFALSRVESVSVADAGLVSAQDYCDPTYFAEDYVGVSQSF